MEKGFQFIATCLVVFVALVDTTNAEELDACLVKFTSEQLIATYRTDNEQIIALSRQGLEECGEHAVLYFNMAMPLRSLGREQEAKEALTKCLEIDPLHSDCLKNLGNMYSDEGRYADAIAQYEHMLEIDPNDDDALDNMAVVRIREGKFAAAVAVASQAVAARPSNVHARITLAKAYLKNEGWREAIDTIDDACFMSPRFPGVQEASNLVRFGARKPILRQARKAKNDAWAQYYRARVADNDREGQEALLRAMKLDSSQPRIMAEYVYWLENDNVNESLEILNRCLEINPEFWPCLMLKGDTLRGAGRTSEAQAVFEAGQEIASFVPSFYWYLGLLLAGQGNTDAALLQLERGFELGEDPAFRGLAAKLYKSQGNVEKAMWHAAQGALAGDAECRTMYAELAKSTR